MIDRYLLEGIKITGRRLVSLRRVHDPLLPVYDLLFSVCIILLVLANTWQYLSKSNNLPCLPNVSGMLGYLWLVLNYSDNKS